MEFTAPRDEPSGAVDRLSREQRDDLAGVIASYALEGMATSPEFEEIAALYLLGEIPADEKHERLAELALGPRSPWRSETTDADRLAADELSPPEPTGAIERLDPDQARELRSSVASAAMDGAIITPAQQEIIARYLLGEITSAERRTRLMALAGFQHPPPRH